MGLRPAVVAPRLGYRTDRNPSVVRNLTHILPWGYCNINCDDPDMIHAYFDNGVICDFFDET